MRTTPSIFVLLVICIAYLISGSTVYGDEEKSSPVDGSRRVIIYKDIVYADPGGSRQLLDLYIPDGIKGKLPLVVWIHGGGWRAGSKERPRAEPLTSYGFAVASINYRLSQEAIFPAQIEDCKTALRWLRASAAKYNLDPARVGVWGSSAGGHLSALVGTSGGAKALEGKSHKIYSSRALAVCDWYGPSDFMQILEGDWTTHGGPNSPESLLLGGTVEEKPDLAKAASPVTYASKDDPPFLIMHGDKDPTVPVSQSIILHKALIKMGTDSTLVIFKGAGHGGAQFADPKTIKKVAEFFLKQLIKSSPTGSYDYSVIKVTADKNKVAAGDQITVTVKIKNLGDKKSKPSKLRIYLAREKCSISGPPPADIQLKTLKFNTIGAGKIRRVVCELTTPAGAQPGDYYIIAKADPKNSTGDKLTDNNFLYSKSKITIN